MLQPVQLFKILCDETRLAVVLLLREAGELCVCDICTATAQPQPKVSRHMAILRDAGLVIDRREGKWIYYRLSSHMPAWAADTITTVWNCQRETVRETVRETLENKTAGLC